jgi:hypothetical protein
MFSLTDCERLRRGVAGNVGCPVGVGQAATKNAASRDETQQATTLRKHTAATQPSNPSPLSEAGGKGAAVLPLTWMPRRARGCRTLSLGSNLVACLLAALKALSSWGPVFGPKDLCTCQQRRKWRGLHRSFAAKPPRLRMTISRGSWRWPEQCPCPAETHAARTTPLSSPSKPD